MFRSAALIAVLATLVGSAAAAGNNDRGSSAAGDVRSGTRADAVRMVNRVQSTLAWYGPEVTFSAINQPNHPMNGAFRDRALYPFVFNMEGWSLADGANAKMVGKNWIETRDPVGREMIRRMIQLAKGPGSGWVDYKWPHPLTHKIQNKTAYIERLGEEWFVGVGVYSDQ
jgi:cytochrome c